MKVFKSAIAILIIASAVLAGLGHTTYAKFLKTKEESIKISSVTSTQAVENAKTCVVFPQGGYFASSTPVQIKCDKDVISATYKWDGEGINRIYNRNAETVYKPTKNKDLSINGIYQYTDWRGKLQIKSFSKKFEFKRALFSLESMNCAVTPEGGIFATSTPVKIKCGDKVVSASYKWTGDKVYSIHNRNAETVYEPSYDLTGNKYLHIDGIYKYVDEGGNIRVQTFVKRYEFQKATHPTPYPYYYPYPRTQSQTVKTGHKITLPTFSQIADKLN
ncbi:MAG: hypothetical protein V1891_04305 [bacterium]